MLIDLRTFYDRLLQVIVREDWACTDETDEDLLDTIQNGGGDEEDCWGCAYEDDEEGDLCRRFDRL